MTPGSRRSRFIDGLLVIGGLAISAMVVGATLRTGRIDYRLDPDLVAMPCVLFAPLGITLLFSIRLAATIPWRQWSAGEWLLPATTLVELGWCEVLLDAGIHLGAWGKLICGPTALLGTPLLGLIAFAIGARSLWKRRGAGYRWTHWLGIALALVATAGYVWFVAIMLAL